MPGLLRCPCAALAPAVCGRHAVQGARTACASWPSQGKSRLKRVMLTADSHDREKSSQSRLPMPAGPAPLDRQRSGDDHAPAAERQPGVWLKQRDGDQDQVVVRSLRAIMRRKGCGQTGLRCARRPALRSGRTRRYPAEVATSRRWGSCPGCAAAHVGRCRHPAPADRRRRAVAQGRTAGAATGWALDRSSSDPGGARHGGPLRQRGAAAPASRTPGKGRSTRSAQGCSAQPATTTGPAARRCPAQSAFHRGRPARHLARRALQDQDQDLDRRRVVRRAAVRSL